MRKAVLLLLFAPLVALPLCSQSVQNPEPVITFDLRTQGYNVDSWGDGSRVGFLSDHRLVVTINQYGPNRSTLKQQVETGVSRLAAWYEGPPVKTLVFDLNKKLVLNQGELGNERVGLVFAPVGVDRFVVSTDTSICLYNSDLQLTNGYPIDGPPMRREIYVSPNGRWIRARGTKGGFVVLDAETLKPAEPPHLRGEFDRPGNEGSLQVERVRQGPGKFIPRLFYRNASGVEKTIYEGCGNCQLHAQFVSSTHILADGRVFATEGTQLYKVDSPRGVGELATSQSGVRFAIGVRYHTKSDTLLHGMDTERPYNRRWVRVFETQSGKLLFEMSWDPRRYRHESGIALSPNGRFLALIRDGWLEVFEVPTE